MSRFPYNPDAIVMSYTYITCLNKTAKCNLAEEPRITADCKFFCRSKWQNCDIDCLHDWGPLIKPSTLQTIGSSAWTPPAHNSKCGSWCQPSWCGAPPPYGGSLQTGLGCTTCWDSSALLRKTDDVCPNTFNEEFDMSSSSRRPSEKLSMQRPTARLKSSSSPTNFWQDPVVLPCPFNKPLRCLQCQSPKWWLEFLAR